MASRFLVSVAAIGLLMGAAGPALAAADRVRYDIPAEPLAQALRDAAARGGFSIAMDDALVAGRAAPALYGDYEPLEAVRHLLAGTGLVVSVRGKVMNVSRPAVGAAVPGARAGDTVLGKLSVSGEGWYDLGPNGSSDVTATEGTGSYTTDLATAGSKMPLSLHDTPQSISVLTSQQIHDQNLFNFTDALKQVPGLYVTNTSANGSSGNPAIFSRGMQINNFQFDGGATYAGTLGGAAATHTLAFDMSEYDHLEVLRGADGMFAGAGDPSGTVNLVRKRPLDHFQVLGQLSAGSWDTFREMVDITGPVAFDGKLRARLVVAHQDNHFFYEVNKSHRTSVYGIVEADITPTTLLTAGFDTKWQHDIGGDYFVPLAQNGADLHLSRSFCGCAPWAGDRQYMAEIFAKLQQKIADGWMLNLNFTHVHQYDDQTYQRMYFLTPYNAFNIYTYGLINSDQNMLDGNIKGSFQFLHQKQDVVFGANFKQYSSYFNSIQNANYGQIPITIPDIYNFNPVTSLVNGFTLTSPRSSPFGWGSNDTQWSVYGFARLSPLSFLHILGGFRVSSYDNNDFFNTSGEVQPVAEKGIVTPYAGLTIDLTRQWSAYYSYTTIFTPQPNNFYGPPPGSKSLPPITGESHEIGIKGRLMHGKLNTSVALYQTHQVNSAVQDPAYSTTVPNGLYGSCCYVAAGDLLTKGIDAEISGQLLPNWQIIASVNYNINRYNNNLAYGANNLNPISTLFPPVMFKIWSTYRLPGKWKDLTIGGGVNGQTKIYGTGTVPTVLSGDGKTFTCPCTAYQFKQNPFAVASLRVAYRFLDHWEAAVDVNNIFDVRYYTALTNPRYNNYYGDPRNFMFSLSTKY